jgi:hypothetical protein
MPGLPFWPERWRQDSDQDIAFQHEHEPIVEHLATLRGGSIPVSVNQRHHLRSVGIETFPTHPLNVPDERVV